MMGAPCKAAATPPTRMKSTPCRVRVRRICRKSGFRVPGTDPQYGINILLKSFQTLSRRERKHPADQGEIDAVFRIRGPIAIVAVARIHPRDSISGSHARGSARTL